MLGELQDRLSDLYQVDAGYRIDDFLITDPALARVLAQNTLLADTDETVLLSEDDEGISMSVYLDEEMLARLRQDNPLAGLRAEQLNDWWTVLEGVSHFTYLAWSARNDKAVTLLELEMQAEVDKFISTWLLALQQDELALADKLHGWLFDEVSYHPELSDAQRERYRAANDYAARFCHGLRQRLQEGSTGGIEELRHFYRLTQTHKIGHIHTQAWAPQ